MVEYEIAVGELETLAALNVIKKHHLYFVGCSLIRTVIAMPERYQPEVITLAYTDGICVGTCITLLIGKFDYNISVYVKSKYRRRGIGSELVRLCKDKSKLDRFIYDDTPESWLNRKTFWEKIKW